MEFSETSSIRSEEENPLIAGTSYIITYKRWIVLATVSLTLFLSTYTVSFFGFINDATTEYFEITPAQTDLLSSLTMFPRFLIGFIVAMMAKKLNLNSILTCSTIFIVVANFLIVTGVSARSNFIITIIGQLLNGSSTAMVSTVTQLTPANWFPKNERGKALSGPWILLRLSLIVSNLVATRTIEGTQRNIQLRNNTEGKVYDERLLVTSFQDSFQIAFSVLAVSGFVCFLLSIFYVTDYPPTVDGTQETSKLGKPLHFISELRETLELFLNKRYVILIVMYSAVLSASPILAWMLTSVVLKGFPELDDSIVGTMFCVGYSAAAFGSPIGGALLDRFRRPKLTYAIGMTVYMLGYGVLSLSIYIHSFKLLFASFVTLTLLRDLSYVCVTHAMVELMQDRDSTAKIRAFSFTISLPTLTLVGYTSLDRVIVENGGPFMAALLPIPFHFVAVVLYVCVY